MKQLFLYPFFALLSFTALGQSLSLSQLLKLQSMGKQEIGAFLGEKGWVAKSDAAPAEAKLGKAVWAFNPEGEGADAWCILYYSDTNPNRILYNTQGGPAFDKIRRHVKQRHMAVLEEGEQIEGLDFVDAYTDYADDQYVARLYDYKQINYYGIKIFTKEDYQKAKKTARL
ncbi:hypothetical protein ACD591_05980 [Rufibacter glacialis]|uniref:Uncharacterized protein n=1 Tax=Rufibacter glacialis TaxID=1259555 RepID=A0A5M8QDP3_9BACT|nr:hypothetical protein [Rufibacter glacialis]KAA6433211.1 hypothetical protein FOE74_12035 [Rufibacter glacialis]GGK76434.1 hypothetical protein GCM10011405_25330 [Rufibacter glacialis]